MAQLRDRSNKIILHVDVIKHEEENMVSNVRLVFQENVFVNDDAGWKDEIQAEICWYQLKLIKNEISNFIKSARDWTELPLSELAKKFFTGIWSLGTDYSTQRFKLEFKPLYHSPSKTDGFTVRIDIVSNFQKQQEFESDYTSLVNFINDLESECLENAPF